MESVKQENCQIILEEFSARVASRESKTSPLGEMQDKADPESSAEELLQRRSSENVPALTVYKQGLPLPFQLLRRSELRIDETDEHRVEAPFVFETGTCALKLLFLREACRERIRKHRQIGHPTDLFALRVTSRVRRLVMGRCGSILLA